MRALLLAALLTGCTFAPTAEEFAKADCGPKCFVAAQVTVAFAQVLRDPGSARYRFGEPQRGWAQIGTDGATVFGWSTPFTVNARNAFGGYTGAQPYKAFFRDGELRAILRPGHRGEGWEVWMR